MLRMNHPSRLSLSQSDSFSPSASPSSIESLIRVVLPQLTESETDCAAIEYYSWKTSNETASPKTQKKNKKKTKTKTKTNTKINTHTKKKKKRRHRHSQKISIVSKEVDQDRHVIKVSNAIDADLRLSVSISRNHRGLQISLMTENVSSANTIFGCVMKWYKNGAGKSQKIRLGKVIEAGGYIRRIYKIFNDTDRSSYDSEGLRVRIYYDLQGLDDWEDLQRVHRRSSKFFIKLD